MQVLVTASESTNEIVSGATQFLMENGWPSDLRIYKDSYIQSIDYVDAYPGIEWYIVVLLPAVLQMDHVAPGSTLYTASGVLASLSVLVSVDCISIAVYLSATSKTFKLTQPSLTLFGLFGGLMMGLTCFVLLGDNSSTRCAARPYLLCMCFTMTFAPLLIRSW